MMVSGRVASFIWSLVSLVGLRSSIQLIGHSRENIRTVRAEGSNGIALAFVRWNLVKYWSRLAVFAVYIVMGVWSIALYLWPDVVTSWFGKGGLVAFGYFIQWGLVTAAVVLMLNTEVDTLIQERILDGRLHG